MNCPICGKENPNDAVFCKYCGRRVDGKKQCRACGKLIDADAAFCNYCGAPASAAPSAAPFGGAAVYPPRTEAPAAFYAEQAPAPAPPYAPAAAYAPRRPLTAEEAAERKQRHANVLQKVMRYCSQGFSLAMAAFALIFVFLVGITATVSANGESASGGTDIYYYFGDVYREIGDLLGGMTEYSGTFATSVYLYAVPQTVLIAVFLLAVAALSITGIVLDILRLTGKRRDGKSVSLYAFLLYTAFAAAFMATNSVWLDMKQLFGSGSFFIHANGATAAGIALGSVFFTLYIACRITANARKLFKENLVTTVLAFVCVPLALVVFSVAATPLVQMFTSGTHVLSAGPLMLLAAIGILCQTDEAAAAFGEGYAAGSIAMLLLCYLFAAAVITVGLLCMRKSWLAALSPQKNGALAWSVVLTACSAGLLVSYIVGTSLFLQGAAGGAEITTEDTFGYAVPIAILIFSLVLLGVNVARKVFAARKYGRQRGAAQPAAFAYPSPAAAYPTQTSAAYPAQTPAAYPVYGEAAAQNAKKGSAPAEVQEEPEEPADE